MTMSLAPLLRRAALALVLAGAGAAAAVADELPKGWQAKNVELIGFSGLGGHYGGFKIAIKNAGPKWYLYEGQSFDQGWSIVDVTDPHHPRYVKFMPYVTDNKGIITAQVTLHGNLMLTALDRREPSKLPAVLLWDISDPENPKQVGSWTGGDLGSHRNSYPGGDYAYMATSYPGFSERIMVILDVSDPTHPKEVGKWWQPGQKEGEPKPEFPEGFHGPVNVSPDGTWASFGFTPDLVNIDLKDKTNPTLIGRLHLTEPFANVGIQSVHTVLPLWDRKLDYVSSEAMKPECKDDGMNFAGMVDNANPAHPRLISIFPSPRPPKGLPYTDYCNKGGRFGPHNTSQEIHNPAVMHPGKIMFVAWFNAGMRVFDVSDPFLPTEIGYFIPPERPGLPDKTGAHASPINWSEELAQDARGNIYLNDDKWGTFVLRYTGKQ
jgi:hypothetical protein